MCSCITAFTEQINDWLIAVAQIVKKVTKTQTCAKQAQNAGAGDGIRYL